MRRLVAIFFVGLGILASIPQWSGAQWVQTEHTGGSWITALALSGPNVFAGTFGRGIFLFESNGVNWMAVNYGLPEKAQVSCFALVEQNIYAGTLGDGVFLFKNNGARWDAFNSGLKDTCVQALAASGTDIFAGTRGGLFHSAINGARWTEVNFGLASASIDAFVVMGRNLFAGTWAGVWRLPLAEIATQK